MPKDIKPNRPIEPGLVYRHFKGNYYLVTGISEHTETGELMVEYTALYGLHKRYSRPYNMFASYVEEGKENPTGQKYRFQVESLPDATKGV